MLNKVSFASANVQLPLRPASNIMFVFRVHNKSCKYVIILNFCTQRPSSK